MAGDPRNRGAIRPLDQSLALGCVIYDASVLADALLLAHAQRGPDGRVAREALHIKARALLECLSDAPSKERISIVHFGQPLIAFGGPFPEFKRFVNERSTHLTRGRLQQGLENVKERTGYELESFGATILDEAVRFIDGQLEGGLCLTADRHIKHLRRLKQKYAQVSQLRIRRARRDGPNAGA